MDERRRELGRRHLGAALGTAALFAVLVPGCGVIVDVPAYVRGTNIQADGTCDPGFGDCNGDTDDGCETRLGTDEGCAACGNSCGNGSCVPKGEGHVCQCAAGFASCDGGGDDCLVELANDPHHCGACDRDCSPGLCKQGVCQPGLVVHALDTFTYIPAPFVVQDGYVYVPGSRSMVRARTDVLTEIEEAELVFAAHGEIENLAWDKKRLAWIERVSGEVRQASIHVGSLDGKENVVLSKQENIQSVDVYTSQPIALDDTTVYWVASTSNGNKPKPTSLRSAPIAGHLAPETALTVNGGFGTVALTTDHVYWNASDNTIHAHPKSDLGQHVDLTFEAYVGFLGSDGDRLCVSAYRSGGLNTIDFFCGSGDDRDAFVHVGKAASGQVGSLVPDAKSLYFTDVIGAQLVRIDRDSMRSAALAPTIGWAGGIVIDGEDIYWRAYNGVWRLRHAIHATP